MFVAICGWLKDGWKRWIDDPYSGKGKRVGDAFYNGLARLMCSKEACNNSHGLQGLLPCLQSLSGLHWACFAGDCCCMKGLQPYEALYAWEALMPIMAERREFWDLAQNIIKNKRYFTVARRQELARWPKRGLQWDQWDGEYRHGQFGHPQKEA